MGIITIEINGNNFSSLDEFFDEAQRVLTNDTNFRAGHNFDAFHDLLRGGFGVFEYGESAEFVWLNSEKSRRELGYEATARYYKKLLEKCHLSNRERILGKIKSAEMREGKTLFDMITEQINDKTDSYNHSLILK